MAAPPAADNRSDFAVPGIEASRQFQMEREGSEPLNAFRCPNDQIAALFDEQQHSCSNRYPLASNKSDFAGIAFYWMPISTAANPWTRRALSRFGELSFRKCVHSSTALVSCISRTDAGGMANDLQPIRRSL